MRSPFMCSSSASTLRNTFFVISHTIFSTLIVNSTSDDARHLLLSRHVEKRPIIDKLRDVDDGRTLMLIRKSKERERLRDRARKSEELCLSRIDWWSDMVLETHEKESNWKVSESFSTIRNPFLILYSTHACIYVYHVAQNDIIPDFKIAFRRIVQHLCFFRCVT